MKFFLTIMSLLTTSYTSGAATLRGANNETGTILDLGSVSQDSEPALEIWVSNTLKCVVRQSVAKEHGYTLGEIHMLLTQNLNSWITCASKTDSAIADSFTIQTFFKSP